MSTQQMKNGKCREKKTELTSELVKGIAAIINNPKFDSLSKKETYRRMYNVILKFSVHSIQNNPQMLDLIRKLDSNANFVASLEIFQLGKWSNIMKQLQIHEGKLVKSENNNNTDLILNDWFKTQCKFEEIECVRYADIFKSNGFDNIDRIKQINDYDLLRVGIQIRDRKIILSNITHLIFTMLKKSKQ
jgi:hypothetical protein